MSVLNTMLRDLERRGKKGTAAPSSPSSRARAGSPVPTALSLAPLEGDGRGTGVSEEADIDSSPRRLPARPALLLAGAVALAAAFWLWPQHREGRAMSAPTSTADGIRPSAPAPASDSIGMPASPQLITPAPQPIAGAQQSTAAVAVAAARLPLSSSSPAASVARLPSAGTTAAAPALPRAHPRSASARAHAAKPPAEPHIDAAPADSAGADKTAAADMAAQPAVAQSADQGDLRHATQLIAQGRSADATDILAGALTRRPDWSDARAMLAALQAEGGDRRQALATLLEGVPFDPARFAPTAAQLQAEFDDTAGALRTLEKVPADRRDRGYHGLVAAVALRGDQPEKAAEEYAAALQFQPSDPVSWAGLGMALQAIGRNADALSAYRSALGGALAPDLRSFVLERYRVLQSLPAAVSPPAKNK